MKKFLYLAAFAAVAICSCSKQESDVALLNKEIGFSTYEERAVTKTDPSNDDPFMVEAYYGGTKYFDAQKVSYSNNVWNLATTYFWPATVDDASHKMEFFAVRQMSGESYTVSNKTVSITSALPATADIRTCYSAATDVPTGAQAMAFTHDLAKVKFTLKAADPNLVYSVTAMKITANKKGTLTIGSSSKSWGSLSDSGDYSITGYPNSPTTTASSVFGTTNIIPQSGVTVSVTYSVKTSGNVIIMSSATKTTTIDLSSNQGKVTQYNLALPSGSSEIKVSCDVTDWNSQSDVPQEWFEPYALKFTASGSQTLNIAMCRFYPRGTATEGSLYTGTNQLPSYEYSYDGICWTDAPIKVSSNSGSYPGIPFGDNGNETLYLRGKTNASTTIGSFNASGNDVINTRFSFGSSEILVACSGDVMSLLNSSQSTLTIPCACEFAYLFKDCVPLTTAPSLPATTLTGSCYQGMFKGCTNLAEGPILPAITMPILGYTNTGVGGPYIEMFNGCTALMSVTIYAKTNIVNSSSMDRLYTCGKMLDNICTSGIFYAPKENVSSYFDGTTNATFPSSWKYQPISISE